MNGLTKAIKSAGTATNLATMLGIKPMSVSRWKTGTRAWCLLIGSFKSTRLPA